MKKALKRSLSLLLAITIIFSSAYVGLAEVDFGSLFVVKAKAATSGTTGDCTWSLDGTVLTISGNGDMYDYMTGDEEPVPWGTNITEVIFRDSVTRIGNCAFSGCTSLTSVTIPNSVTSIGRSAFYDCTNLTSVVIPDSVISIESYAFNGCSSFNSIVIPDSVFNVGQFVFGDTGYYNDASNWENNVLYIDSFLIDAKNSISGYYAIKNDTKNIVGSAFKNCKNLVSVTIPNSVISIGDCAFFECTSLTSITIPNSVTHIGDSVVGGCTRLTSIIIGENVTNIGDGAFAGCTVLEKVNWNAKNVADFDIDSFVFNGAGTSGTGIEFVFGDSVQKIPGNLFCEEYYMGYSPTKSKVISIIIGDNITSIGEEAFRGCTSLTSISIPNSVTNIGDYSFSNCTSLTSITIPDSVTSIGNYAFDNCKSLNAVYITDIARWCGITFYVYTSNPLYYAKNLYLNGGLVADLVIPNRATSIGSYAFYNCSNLTSVTIPDSVKSIGYDAFYGTQYYKDTSNWQNQVLYISNHLIEANNSIEGSYAVKNGTKSIADYAFRGCRKLTSVTIPSSVTSISSVAFHNCTSLKSINVDKNNTKYSSSNGVLLNKSKTKLIKYPIGKLNVNYKIPDSVTSISNYAFYNCHNLTSVTIPNSVKSIGDNAFNGCTNLKDIYYKGSKEQWEKISISSGNDSLKSATIHYYLDNFAVNSKLIAAENGTILFSVYNKDAWAEVDILNLASPGAHSNINDATFVYNGTTKTLTENYVYIKKTDLSKGITVTATDFQKYVIPSTVTNTWEPGAPLDFSVYMTKDRKDGKTYISTVFARNCSEDDDKEYIDVTTNNLNLLNGVKTDVVVTAVQQDSPVKEYYLSQDEKHKISDVDGIFSAVDLYSKFDENKPVYAYAVLKNGNTTEPVSVSLKKQVTSNASATVINALENGNLSFFGKDGFKYTLSDEIPIVGGANITAGIPTIPVGFEMQNERVRISIGADIFKKENDNGNIETEWFNFKETCRSVDEVVSKTNGDVRKYKNLLLANQFGTVEDTKKNLDLSFLGYIEGYIIDGELVFKEVCGTAALSFFFNYKQQFLVAGIPAIYAYVKAGGELAGSVSGARPIADTNLPVEFDLAVSFTPSVKVGGGVGVKDAISAGVWGKGSMPVGYNFSDTHLTLGLKGEIGLEAEFFILKGDVTLLDGSLNLVDHYFNSSKTSLSGQSDALYSGNAVDVFKDGEVSLADRSYLANTSEWLGGQSASPYSLRRTITPESVKISDLQTSVYKNSQTQLVQFGDTMLMAWIEDCADRDDYNRMRLVYSVYDIGTGLWSAPQAVADNGKCDSAPSLATDGENVYIAWQNIDYTVSTADKETVGTIMENAEIRLAKYNPQTNAFENVKTITNNSTYDYAHKATVNNGVAEVYWVNSASADFQKGTLSIQKSDFNGATSTVLSGLNYVHCVDSNGTDVSYTMDKDGDTSTTTDIKVYTNSEQVSVDYKGVDVSCLYSTYAMLGGKKTLFYVDDYNLCYIQNGEEKVVFDSPRSINGNLQVCSDGTKTTAMWLEAGEMGTELYTCTYENGEWSSPVQLTNLSKVLSNVALTYFDGKIYGVFNRTNLEEVTSQIDGSIYYKNGTTDLCQLTTEGFTDISLSLIDIDESLFVPGSDVKFTVLAENNGTEKITNVSFEVTDDNGYAKTIEKTVDLASGESEFIELTYTVPEAIAQTELSVYAVVNVDTDESDNTTSINIGTPDLEIGELNVQFVAGVYIVNGVVTNKNSVAANNVVVNAFLGEATENALITSNIGVIKPHTSTQIEFMIDDSVLNFDDTSYYDVTINIASSDEERIAYNNESVTVISETGIHAHSYGDWVTEKEATCTEDGSRYQECSGCGDKITETVTAKGHIYSEAWTVDKAATCTEDGSKSHHCTGCDAKKDITVIKATDHITSNWIINNETNTKHKECTVCGKVLETQPIATIVDSGTCGENLTWELDDKGVLTISGTGDMADYNYRHSSELGFYSDSPFYKSNEIRSVVLTNGITSIGSYIFTSCTNLTSITIPDTVTSIGNYAFYKCSSLKTIAIPESVKSIGFSAFDSCVSLASINIPSGVTIIDEYTFNKCSSLTSITIPNCATSINYRAFYDCTNLTSITIPESVKSIGYEAFYNCTSLKNVYYKGSATDFSFVSVSSRNEYLINATWHYAKASKPATPKVTSTNAIGGVQVNWNKIAGATKYVVYRRNAGQTSFTQIGTTTSTTFLDKNVKSGQYYCYTVRAFNATGDYSAYVYANTSTRKYMATPKLTTIYNHVNGLAIKWNAVAGVTNGYRVYRRSAGSTYWTYLGTTKNLYFIDSQVKNRNGEYYRYTVIADGGYHSKFDTTGLYLRRLANPTLNSAVSSKSGITVKWGKVAGSSGYYVYRKTANSTWSRIAVVKGVNGLSYLDKTAKKGTTYTYTVRAVYGNTLSSYYSGISCKDKY